MKIIRFRGPRHSYGYIRANIFERIYLRGRIAGGDTGVYEIEGWEPGPRSYSARFIVRAKRTQKEIKKPRRE